jgi:hypothetical protein
MVSYVIYGTNPNTGATGKSGNWFKEAMRLTGTTFDLVTESDQGPRSRSTGKWNADATDPTKFHVAFSCPSASDAEFGFTFLPGQITFFYSGAGAIPAVAVYNLVQ